MVALILIAGVAGIIVLFITMERDTGMQAVNSLGDTVDPSEVPQPPADESQAITAVSVMALARGVGRGEGFWVAGSLPQRSNNPGDLTKSFGFSTTGIANKEGVLIFATIEDGWSALYKQLGIIFDGTSRVYKTDMTIWEFAYTWTLGRPPRTASENASVGGWAAAVLEEVNSATQTALTAQSTLGDIAV